MREDLYVQVENARSLITEAAEVLNDIEWCCIMFSLDGMSEREIGRIFELGGSNVHYHVKTGFAKMRAWMKANGVQKTGDVVAR